MNEQPVITNNNTKIDKASTLMETESKSTKETKQTKIIIKKDEWDVFISYSWGDKKKGYPGCQLASHIKDYLEQHKIKVYLDNTAKPGSNENDHIAALKSSKVILVLLDKNSTRTATNSGFAQELPYILDHSDKKKYPQKSVLFYDIDEKFNRTEAENSDNKLIQRLGEKASTRIFRSGGKEIERSKENLKDDVKGALARLTPKRHYIPLLIGITLCVSLVVFFMWLFFHPLNTPTTLNDNNPNFPKHSIVVTAGGGTVANKLLSDGKLENVTYVPMPSEVAWYLLADYPYAQDAWGDRYEPVVLSAERITEENFKKRTNYSDKKFPEDWKVVEYYLGSTKLNVVLYARDTSVFHKIKIDTNIDVIKVGKLKEILRRDETYILRTDTLSGTYASFKKVIDDPTLLIKLKNAEKLNPEDDNKRNCLSTILDVDSTKDIVIVLCNELYRLPPQSSNNKYVSLPNGSLFIVDKNGDTVHQPLYMYTLARRVWGSHENYNYEILPKAYNYLCKTCGLSSHDGIFSDGSKKVIRQDMKGK